MNAPTTISAMRSPSEANMPVVAPGFGSLQSFELMQRQAKLLCSSTLVPAAYRSVFEKLDYKGNVKERSENPNALSNCVIALNMAARMNADPLMVMQNLYLVEGRPSWSSQWIIAQVNNCGRFSPLRFDIQDLGEKTVDYTTYQWDEQSRKKIAQVQKVKIHDKRCIAWVVEKGTEERLYSPPVSIAMAVAEGWYSKNGSKWQTMDEVMLRYRAAAFFGKIYAPELLMGLPSAEEAADTIDMEVQDDGRYAMAQPVTMDDLRADPSTSPALEQKQPATVPQQPRQRQGEKVDAGTGEVLDLAQQWAKYDEVLADYGEKEAENFEPMEPRPNPGSAPTFADAHAAVRSGDLDLARDIARSLPDQQRQQIEAAIANLSGDQQQQDASARGRGRQRGQGGLGLE